MEKTNNSNDYKIITASGFSHVIRNGLALILGIIGLIEVRNGHETSIITIVLFVTAFLLVSFPFIKNLFKKNNK